MIALVLAFIFTLTVSGFCSLMEAFILSITTSEIEGLKQQNPTKGERLEHFNKTLDETSSAILTLNTVANTAGASLVGYFASQIENPPIPVAWFALSVTAVLIVSVLLLAEILPKNLGVAYRKQLAPFMIKPLGFIRYTMQPFSSLAKRSIKPFLPNLENRDREILEEESEQEIVMLANKHAQDGNLSFEERDLISNALKLDEIAVEDIMTPRTVVAAIDAEHTIGDIYNEYKGNIPFARLPVYRDTIDEIEGFVRRRELLSAYANDEEDRPVTDFVLPLPYVPDTATASDVLKTLLRAQQQLAIVVNEFGATQGVIAMEDIVEHLLGREIFESDDIAVDMRELAKKRAGHQVDISMPEVGEEVPTPDPTATEEKAS